MLERTYTKEEWTRALRELSGKYRVFVPVKQAQFHAFKVLEEGKEPDFTYSNTHLSAKGILYPPSERMFECRLDEKDPAGNVYREAEKDYTPQAVVGIRPCDAQGFEIVKRNFYGFVKSPRHAFRSWFDTSP